VQVKWHLARAKLLCNDDACNSVCHCMYKVFGGLPYAQLCLNSLKVPLRVHDANRHALQAVPVSVASSRYCFNTISVITFGH